MPYTVLQILTVILIAVALALALAHALELPGKRRLNKEAYLATQTIYYPGFTIGGGIGEAGGTVSTIVLLFFTPPGTAAFWLMLVALLGLIAMQVVFWIFTQPTNRFWLKEQKLRGFSSAFFSVGVAKRSQEQVPSGNWIDLRNRWEYSHVARAAFAFVSLICAVIATTSNR